MMEKKTGSGDSHDTELQIWPQEVCRFAYTINNEQPVRCTWISDQPLFYSDYDGVMDDDSLFDDPLFQALERDIAELREKTNAYDKISREFSETEEQKLAFFRSDATFVSAPASSIDGDLDALFGLAHKSRLASQYLSFAQLNNIDVLLSNQVMDASYDRAAQTILVRSDLDPADQVLLLSRELRRMYQHKSGAGLHPLLLHPDFAVVVNRAQTADLTVTMIRVAWEIYLSGDKSVWGRIEQSPMDDLGRAFAREAIADFRSIGNGQAARGAFESWFLSERCRKADRLLIQQMLADYQGYSFSDNPEASRFIAMDLMKALGTVPFGQNYLGVSASQMLSDPVFTDVRDRSNANFLWFIKFERSFSEAEKEVKDEKTNHPTAKVLAFPVKRNPSPEKGKSKSGGNQIIDLCTVGQD